MSHIRRVASYSIAFLASYLLVFLPTSIQANPIGVNYIWQSSNTPQFGIPTGNIVISDQAYQLRTIGLGDILEFNFVFHYGPNQSAQFSTSDLTQAELSLDQSRNMLFTTIRPGTGLRATDQQLIEFLRFEENNTPTGQRFVYNNFDISNGTVAAGEGLWLRELPVPEPTTFAILTFGLLCLGLGWRRKGGNWQFLNNIETDDLLGNGRVYGGGIHKLEPKELRSYPAGGLIGRLPGLEMQRQTSLFEEKAA